MLYFGNSILTKKEKSIMRSAMFLGCIVIAESILRVNELKLVNEEAKIFGIIFIVYLFMDVIQFITKTKTKKF